MYRALRSDEIELRVGSVSRNANGFSLLCYKDARCDQNILDEVFGAEYWQRDHKEVKGNLYGGVGIWNDTLKQWVWKWDCGTESFTEKAKGESSDSFKRACFNLGIGRELYTSPFIWIDGHIGNDGKPDSKWVNGLYVSAIDCEEVEQTRKIKFLEIKDRYGDVVYRTGEKKKKETKPKAEKKIDRNKISAEINKIIAVKGLNLDEILTQAKVSSFADLTDERLEKFLEYVRSK